MRALTIHQPYAELIARGVKTFETRPWGTVYRGAARGPCGEAMERGATGGRSGTVA